MRLDEIQTALIAGAVVGCVSVVVVGFVPAAASTVTTLASLVVTGIFALARGPSAPTS